MSLIFFGWGKDSKKLCDISFEECSHCKKMVMLELKQYAKKFELYFIPIVRWSKKYYVACPNCSYGFDVTKEQADKLKADSAELPKTKLIFACWNDLMNYIKTQPPKFNTNEDVNNYSTDIVEHLRKLGYEKEVIDYVVATYFRELAKNVTNKCVNCNSVVSNEDKFCKDCGQKIEN